MTIGQQWYVYKRLVLKTEDKNLFMEGSRTSEMKAAKIKEWGTYFDKS